MNVYFVQVTTDDRDHRIWAAATSAEEAVDRVLNEVPEGWAAHLTDEITQAQRNAVLGMRPGEVKELAT